jgi:hypothetical protein
MLYIFTFKNFRLQRLRKLPHIRNFQNPSETRKQHNRKI